LKALHRKDGKEYRVSGGSNPKRKEEEDVTKNVKKIQLRSQEDPSKK
jgi:hypothetical protein